MVELKHRLSQPLVESELSSLVTLSYPLAHKRRLGSGKPVQDEQVRLCLNFLASRQVAFPCAVHRSPHGRADAEGVSQAAGVRLQVAPSAPAAPAPLALGGRLVDGELFSPTTVVVLGC